MSARKKTVERPERIELWFKDGKSDKVYNIDLARDGTNGWSVIAEYGRRGSKLQRVYKTHGLTTWLEAKSVFDRTLADKTIRGYNVVPDDGKLEAEKRKALSWLMK